MTTTAAHPTALPAAARRAELEAALGAVTARVAAAAAACGRDPRGITLVAVTKTRPAADARLLHALGVRHLGENHDREAAAKAADLADLAGHPEPPQWHFVGSLQRNKAASVARYASLVHSVDRPALVAALSRGALNAGRTLPCLLQVSLDGDPCRGGVPADGLAALADAVADAPGLRLAGVMAVAPLGGPADAAFDRLAALAARLRADHPRATAVSAGMSGDLETAVAAGATHVRIGSALLGGRAYPARDGTPPGATDPEAYGPAGARTTGTHATPLGGAA
ncbi:YggS family pyridoxal phosphate-dependent enzyme [Streptomyces sp. C10-9-1]|uniref:YggS family pyridoxal phosphate-dependent enzyme n=1 Tax=Streptomyces sp. C10-9-1 TaxID=1859285 RepID=UPI003D717CC3